MHILNNKYESRGLLQTLNDELHNMTPNKIMNHHTHH